MWTVGLAPYNNKRWHLLSFYCWNTLLIFAPSQNYGDDGLFCTEIQLNSNICDIIVPTEKKKKEKEKSYGFSYLTMFSGLLEDPWFGDGIICHSPYLWGICRNNIRRFASVTESVRKKISIKTNFFLNSRLGWRSFWGSLITSL